MIDFAPFVRAAFAVVALLGSLGMVTWRQSRALEVLGRLDDVRRQISIADAERIELEQRIQVLESRAHVAPAARRRLGMHTAAASEMVILAAEGTP